MKKTLVSLLLFVMLTIPFGQVSAQTSEYSRLLAQLQMLFLQLSQLQAQLAAKRSDEQVLGVNARHLELSQYYRGPYEAIYTINGTDIEPYKNTVPSDEDIRLWELFRKVVGNRTIRNYITEFRVYRDEHAEYDAFVEQIGTTDDWIFGVNLANTSTTDQLLRQSTIELFVHEYAHILFYYNPQIGERFEDMFWRYRSHDTSNFVSDYAMTNAEEDFAESFRAFVLNERPRGNLIRNEKVQFFYDYDFLGDLRDQIRHRLFN